jgi:hypothetical protein
MFGMNKISTKVDHFAAFKKVVDTAISTATDAHVGSRVIIQYLQERAKWLDDATYVSPMSEAATLPRMYGEDGKLDDYVRQAEEARVAREKLRQLQEDQANAGRKRIR